MTYTRSEFPDTFLFGLSASDPGDEALTEGFDSFRFPVHWQKVLPQGRGEPDSGGLDHYKHLIDTVLRRGLRPCAILDSSTLPDAVADLGGWRNRDCANWFAQFAETVIEHIGDRLFSAGPAARSWTGGKSDHLGTDLRAHARSLHHHLLATGHAIRAMRSYGMTNLGVEFQLDEPQANTALHTYFHGEYTDDYLAKFSPYLPRNWQRDFDSIDEPIDWCALNYAHFKDLDGSLPWSSLQRDDTGETPLYVVADLGSVENTENLLGDLRSDLEQGAPIKGLFAQAQKGECLGPLQTALSGGNQPAPWVAPTKALHGHWNMVADVGGTNTRLGVVTNGHLDELHKFPTGSLEDFQAALRRVRDAVGTDPQAVVAAGAGPLRDGVIQLTNASLTLSRDTLASSTGAQRTFVINDFTAAAWSVADITAKDVAVLQGSGSPPPGTRLVVGPGTGLGVGALLYSEGHYHTVSGEGGHMGLSPRHRDEVDVFDAARRIAPECFFADSLAIEAEMFLSGTGLPILYQAVCMAGGQSDTPTLSAKDILQAAQSGADEFAVKTAHMFTEHLGAITGDLAVALIPVGGVFLLGGVADKNRWLFGREFLDAFNAGGRFDDIRGGLNLYVSEMDEFGIVGANNFCKNALAR
ncbi:MAG: family 1 glycosylhydrolase [Ruegeria sp.]